jgi:hypothetical protein
LLSDGRFPRADASLPSRSCLYTDVPGPEVVWEAVAPAMTFQSEFVVLEKYDEAALQIFSPADQHRLVADGSRRWKNRMGHCEEVADSGGLKGHERSVTSRLTVLRQHLVSFHDADRRSTTCIAFSEAMNRTH